MNDTQSRILNYLKRFITNNGYSPSIREIQQDCGLSSTSIAKYHLAALEAAGHIAQEAGIARSIRLVQDAERQKRMASRAALLAELWQAIGEPGRCTLRAVNQDLAERIERVV